MSHTFNLKNDKPWLKESHRMRSNRSLELGKQAVDLLIKQKKAVTYTNVAKISKEIDPEGKGIHPNTIRVNQQLYDYYKQHSLTYKLKENSKNTKPKAKNDMEKIEYRKIKPNRNVESTRRKYMKLSKEEIVQRLIHAEQYIANNHSKWVSNYFEMFK